MANLETLELKISANAQEATKGLGSLIGSLQSLSDALIKPYSDLRDFNAELLKLKKIGKIKITFEGKQSFKEVYKSAKEAEQGTSVVSQKINEIIDTLDKPLKFNMAESMDRVLGIGSIPKSAEESAKWMDYLLEVAERAKTTVASVKKEFVPDYSQPYWDSEKHHYVNTEEIQKQNEELRKTKERASEAKREVAALFAQLRVKADYSFLGDAIDQMQHINTEAKSAAESMSVFMQEMQGDTDIARTVREANPELQKFCEQAMDAGTESQNLTSDLADVDGELKMKKTDAEEAASGLESLRQGFKKLTSGISQFFNRVKRVATTMLIRRALRSMVSYAKEGVTNLYKWSQSVNGTFASAMDTAKTKITTLKNSLGAMLSPAISALIPLFNSLTSAVISAANWINQFISLLSGKTTWTKAIEKGTEDVEELGKEASGTGSAVKDMIASFDELNVITSSSGSSSGIGAEASEEYEGLFEDIDTFDSKIRGIADFVKTNLETIKTLAVAAGAALLAWKLSTAFAEVLPTLSSILGYVATGAAIAITVALTWMLTNEYLQTGDTGYLWTEVLTTAFGATAAAVIAKKLIGGQAGAYAASITLTLSALTGITAVLGDSDVSAFSKESITTLIVNALKAGLAVGILLKTVGSASLLTSAAGAGAAALAVFGVSIGLKASLDPNVELFSVEYIASTVGAAVATGLAAFLFTSSVATAGIAAIAVFGVLIGIKLFTKKEDTKWGNLNLTQEQINEYVQTRMFDAEARVRITQYTTLLANKSSLEESIRTKLTEINTEYDILKLGLDKQASYDKIKELLGDENSGLIKDLGDLIDTNIDMLKITFTNITAYDGQGNVLSKDTLLSAIPAWQDIKNEMQTNGEELTKLLYKGATEQLTPSEEEYAQELLAKVTSLSQKITSATAFGTAAADFKTAALSAMSKGSVEGIKEAFETYSSQNEETIRSTLKETISSYYALADLTDDPVMKQKWLKIANDLTAGFEDTVKAELKKTNSPGAQMVLEWFTGKYKNLDTDNADLLNGIENLLTSAGLTAEGIQGAIDSVLRVNGVDQVEIDLLHTVGFTGFESLSEELQTQLLDWITVSPETIQLLKDGLGIDASQIITFSGWEQLGTEEQQELFTALQNAYGTAEAVAALKKAVPDISAVDIIKTSNWDKMTSDQQLMLIDALGDAFGSEEALNAAKEAGIDVGDAVTKGMNSKSTAVQEAAKKWDKEITDNFDNTTHKTAVDVAKGAKFNEHKNKITSDVENKTIQMKAALAKNSSFDTNKDKFAKEVSDKKSNMQVSVAKIAGEKGFDKTLKTYVDTVNAKSGYVKVGATKKTGSDGFDTALGKIITMVNKKTGTVKTFVELADGQKVALETQLAKLGVNMKVAAYISNLADVVGTIRSEIKKKFGTLLEKFGWKWEAEGGIVNSGDIFVANENGKSEMIGRFGNHTGVANQEQMVEAMARGVEYAQASQNSLLREQNALLRAILAKEGTVQIGASSALGRTVRQSLQMYNSMTGG